MPDTTDPKIETEAPPGQEAAPAAPASPLKAKLKLLVFAVAVVVAECLLAYLYLPTAEDAAAMSIAVTAQGPSARPPFDLDEEGQGVQEELAEVDLGEFTVTSYQPVSSTTLRIDFHLFGTVAAKDKEDFDLQMEGKLHRFREEVIVIVRGTELDDLTDAGLGLIKRKILEKTNRSLGRPLLQAVIFSDFSFIEQ